MSKLSLEYNYSKGNPGKPGKYPLLWKAPGIGIHLWEVFREQERYYEQEKYKTKENIVYTTGAY